jgi:hypothetical protein
LTDHHESGKKEAPTEGRVGAGANRRPANRSALESNEIIRSRNRPVKRNYMTKRFECRAVNGENVIFKETTDGSGNYTRYASYPCPRDPMWLAYALLNASLGPELITDEMIFAFKAEIVDHFRDSWKITDRAIRNWLAGYAARSSGSIA